MRLTAYGSAGLVEQEAATVESFRASLADPAREVTWLDVDGVGDAALLEAVGQAAGLHRLTLADIANTNQRAKVEDYGSYLYVVLRSPLKAGGNGRIVECEQISLCLGPRFVISFQEEHKPGDCYEEVRIRLRQAHAPLRTAGADALMHALMDASIDAFFPMLEEIGERLESLEDRSTVAMGPGTIRELHDLRRELITVRRAAWPMRDATGALIREQSPLIREGTRIYLRDAYDHLVQVMDLVETSRELATGLIEMHLSLASFKLNEVMKVLTIITTVFIPLSFIAGIYGMNFDTNHPANMPETRWEYGYPIVLGMMLAIAVAMMWAFWRKGWLGSRES
ncbi:MAG: magnesium/cobalt transporter CorA [Phycisphaerae bacterium]